MSPLPNHFTHLLLYLFQFRWIFPKHGQWEICTLCWGNVVNALYNNINMFLSLLELIAHQRVFDLPRHREAASLALKHSAFRSYSLCPTWSTSESPFKRMPVSLYPVYKGNSGNEIACPKLHSRLIAKIKWKLCMPSPTNVLLQRLQREIRQAF